MKHIRTMSTQQPMKAALDLATAFTALSQILQVVGTMLVEKQAATGDPYDY